MSASWSDEYFDFFLGRGCGSGFSAFGLEGVAVARGGSGIESGRVGPAGIDWGICIILLGKVLVANRPTEGPGLGGGMGPMVVAIPVGILLSKINSSTERFDVRRVVRRLFSLTGTVDATEGTYPNGYCRRLRGFSLSLVDLAPESMNKFGGARGCRGEVVPSHCAGFI